MRTNLTEAVKMYQRHELQLKQVEDLIAVTIYNYSPLRSLWDEDACSDFLCYFYSRIKPMVCRFQDRGSPFEAFLKVAVQYQMKTFALKLKRRRLEERILTSGEFWEKTLFTETCWEEESEITKPEDSSPLFINRSVVWKNEGLKKKLLLLIMREHDRINESFLVHFITITGYDREWLEEKLAEIRELTRAAAEKKERCRKRRNQALFNVYCIHDELRLYHPPDEEEKIICRLERELNSIKRAEKSLSSISSRPTHKQLSMVLNIPKGTVDSGLHYLSKKYNS